MMKLGIIGAMDEEVSILKEKLEAEQVKTIASMDFHEGKLEGKDVVIVRSGIGKVNAAVCTQILVSVFEVDCVINTGVAGSLRNEINIGDIVLSKDALNHDMDATGFGYEPGIIPRMEVNTDISTFVGRVVSGDQFISDAEKKKYLVEKFQGYCTEMEGAAIAQTAYLNKIPYLVIRAISDKADNSAEMDYSEFERKAIEHTVKLVTGMTARM